MNITSELLEKIKLKNDLKESIRTLLSTGIRFDIKVNPYRALLNIQIDKDNMFQLQLEHINLKHLREVQAIEQFQQKCEHRETEPFIQGQWYIGRSDMKTDMMFFKCKRCEYVITLNPKNEKYTGE